MNTFNNRLGNIFRETKKKIEAWWWVRGIGGVDNIDRQCGKLLGENILTNKGFYGSDIRNRFLTRDMLSPEVIV